MSRKARADAYPLTGAERLILDILRDGGAVDAQTLADYVRHHEGPLPPPIREHIARALEPRTTRSKKRLRLGDKYKQWFAVHSLQSLTFEYQQDKKPEPYETAVTKTAKEFGVSTTVLKRWATNYRRAAKARKAPP